MLENNLLTRRVSCGELNLKNINSKMIVISGWVFRYRDQGGVIFLDLRERSGSLQIVFDRAVNEALWKQANELRSEDVICVEGVLRARSKETINTKVQTGEIELIAHQLILYNKASYLPLSTSEYDSEISEEHRLRHRFIDMRRAETQKILRKRHELISFFRNFLNNQNFWEIETPILNKSTPEGARDFLVPSRLNVGELYALPQSPQIFKQILMVGQIERYYQIARCFRDEDLRKDRQPEFTQLDIEMSFMNRDQIMNMMEEMFINALNTIFDIKLETNIPKISYKDAMETYGTDAPDIRFKIPLIALDEWVNTTSFKVFQNTKISGGRIIALCVPGGAQLSRKELDDLTTWVIQDFKAKGLAWIKHTQNGLESVIVKFIPTSAQSELIKKTNSKPGDIILFSADQSNIVFSTLSALRLKLAERFNLIPKNKWKAIWVINFPLFKGQNNKFFDSMHNPFSSPSELSLEELEQFMTREHSQYTPEETNKILNMNSLTYDLVLNGVEIGGGGIRNHHADIQKFIFKLLGLSEEEIEDKFAFILRALASGAPPHGGIAFGLDRILMLALKKQSIRDVIAFPKTQKGQCLMSDAPSKIPASQLAELKLKSTLK